jgi:hypothetical protein
MAQTGIRENRFEPSYVRLWRDGELKHRADDA